MNDRRSEYLHKCITYLILTALPLATSFLIFTLTGIDKNSIDKEYKIKIINPINIKKDIFPIEVQGELKSGKIEIDFSDGLKEYIKEKGKFLELKKCSSHKGDVENIQTPDKP